LHLRSDKVATYQFPASHHKKSKMKNRTANLRRLIDKYPIRYGEQDPIVLHLKNELVARESGQEIIDLENFKMYPSGRSSLERSKDLESIAS
jgi:hypothetical protein